MSFKEIEYTRDSDGDPIWEEPNAEVHGPDWDMAGDPHTMGMKALCAAVASEILGCAPRWNGYYGDWCCTCKGNVHGCDSQCSALAGPSLLYCRVVAACAEQGITLQAVQTDDVLRNALEAWRKTE